MGLATDGIELEKISPVVAALDAGIHEHFGVHVNVTGTTKLPPGGIHSDTFNVRNPHSVSGEVGDFMVGGSSGGSAAGLAEGTDIINSGSDIAGSIRIPAAMNGQSAIVPPADNMLVYQQVGSGAKHDDIDHDELQRQALTSQPTYGHYRAGWSGRTFEDNVALWALSTGQNPGEVLARMQDPLDREVTIGVLPYSLTDSPDRVDSRITSASRDMLIRARDAGAAINPVDIDPSDVRFHSREELAMSFAQIFPALFFQNMRPHVDRYGRSVLDNQPFARLFYAAGERLLGASVERPLAVIENQRARTLAWMNRNGVELSSVPTISRYPAHGELLPTEEEAVKWDRIIADDDQNAMIEAIATRYLHGECIGDLPGVNQLGGGAVIMPNMASVTPDMPPISVQISGQGTRDMHKLVHVSCHVARALKLDKKMTLYQQRSQNTLVAKALAHHRESGTEAEIARRHASCTAETSRPKPRKAWVQRVSAPSHEELAIEDAKALERGEVVVVAMSPLPIGGEDAKAAYEEMGFFIADQWIAKEDGKCDAVHVSVLYKNQKTGKIEALTSYNNPEEKDKDGNVITPAYVVHKGDKDVLGLAEDGSNQDPNYVNLVLKRDRNAVLNPEVRKAHQAHTTRITGVDLDRLAEAHEAAKEETREAIRTGDMSKHRRYVTDYNPDARDAVIEADHAHGNCLNGILDVWKAAGNGKLSLPGVTKVPNSVDRRDIELRQRALEFVA